MTSGVTSVPWRPLLRSLSATAGRAAAQRALPLYLSLWITASVLLEGNGARPADMVARMHESLGARAFAYGIWTIASLPAIRALLTTPSSFFLRTLPIPRWQLLACVSGGLLLAELPWAYVWLRGGGLGLGLAHVAAALGAASLLLSRLARPVELLAAALLLLVLGAATPWFITLAVSVPAAVLGGGAVWLRAPEPRSSSGRTWIGSSPSAALAASYWLLLWRRARAQLARALALTCLALLVSYFALLNNPPGSAGSLLVWALSTLSPALLLVAASLAGPLLQAELQLSWLLAVCGTEPGTLRMARAAPLAAASAALGTLHALALGLALRLPPERHALLWLSELLAAVLLAVLALGLARWAIRGDGNDSGRLVLGVGAALLALTVSLVWLGVAALCVWTAAAALAWQEPWRPRRSVWAGPIRLER